VLAELKYEPSVKVTDIGVLVNKGTVTLNGFVATYSEKWNAVRAARRVLGVNAIADDIEVRLPGSLSRADGDIAAEVASQIKWSTMIPPGTVKVTVRDGWITLDGELEWAYQKTAAEDAARHLAGVKGVGNMITIKPRVSATDIETSIERAFARNGQLDDDAIDVDVSGAQVTLTGRARNNSERDEAERIAWAAPGVSFVENKIKLDWSFWN